MVNLGAKCGLEDLETIVYLDNLCSQLGLDCISTSGVLAFAMELYQRGILTREDTDGIDLSWGNGQAMEKLVRQIACKEGLGAILALGVSRAAQLIGKNSQKYAYHVKDMELSAYHPSEVMGTALGYAVSARGGDFNTLYASLEYAWDQEKSLDEFGTATSTDIKHIQGKGILLRRAMIVNIVFDSLGICKVPALSLVGAFDLENEATLLSSLSGQNWQAKDLFHLGEKVANLERLFNIKFGASNKDDALPEWFFQYQASEIREPGNTNWLEPMLKDFYANMGWDMQGRPTKSKLRELGLSSYVY
jgi:aldehyde:ferredoxin oxidoreductase